VLPLSSQKFYRSDESDCLPRRLRLLPATGMPLFSYRWQQSFVSPFVPSDDDVVIAFLQVRMTMMISSPPFSTRRLSPLF
jgi:hypothetical protein